MVVTSKLNITQLSEGQSGAEITANGAIHTLDAFSVCTVLAYQTAPPGSPADGDLYLVKATGTGAWATHDNQLALYRNGWIFITPKEGMKMWLANNDIFLFYDGTNWRGYTQHKGKAIQNPVGADNVKLFFTQKSVIITKLITTIRAGTNVVYRIRHDTSRSAAGTALTSSDTTTTSTTTGDVTTSFSGTSTVPANSYVWYQAVSVSGSVTMLDVDIFFQELLV